MFTIVGTIACTLGLSAFAFATTNIEIANVPASTWFWPTADEIEFSEYHASAPPKLKFTSPSGVSDCSLNGV
ncbi:MAG: hypothetical protein V4692_01475, partial [Bdellovibrionota bacterium]